MPTFNLLDDSFTRANAAAGGMGSSAVGNSWIDCMGGLFSISGNQLLGSSEGTSSWSRDWLLRPPAEQRRDSQVIVDFATTMVGTQWGGVVLRAQMDSPSRDAYICYVQPSANTVQIWKLTGATLTAAASLSSLKSGTFTFTAGHQYELTFSATGSSPTTLTATLVDVTNSNTTVINISVTDSTASLQAAGYMGLLAEAGSSIPYIRARTYDMGAASLVASGGSPATIGGPIAVNSTGNVVSLVGNSAAWTAGSPGTPTFTLSGGTGASITSQTVTDANHATVTINAGSAAGTLTITDPSTGLTATITVAAPISVNDPNIFLSPWNWYVNGSTYAQASNGGAYFRMVFSGTSLTMLLDISTLTAAGCVGSGGGNSSLSVPKLRWSIDNAPWVDQYISPTGIQILASGLTSGSHTIECYMLDFCGQNIDRWNTPSGIWRITGFRVDAGAATSAPTLRSKRTLLLGDSITEGKLNRLDPVNALAWVNDATQSYSIGLGYGLSSEIGIIAFSGQTLQSVTAAVGSVPPSAYNPGNDTASTWNKYYAGQSRLVGGLFSPQPDYIVINLGVNDRSSSVAAIQAAYTGLLQALRGAAPAALIFAVVPFGQPANPVTAITAAVAAVNDTKIYLTNLGAIAGVGYGTPSSATNLASDNLHPNNFGHQYILSYVAAAIQKQQDGQSSNPTTRRRRLN